MYDVKPIVSKKQFDCGPTCLCMLLGYYDIEVPLEDLIAECNTRIIGCSAADLKRVGNAHGLDVIAYSMDAEELIKQDRPAIIWWKYGHWCVFCGQDEQGQVFICNPDRGRYRMSQSLFKAFYSGVSLFNGEPGDVEEG